MTQPRRKTAFSNQPSLKTLYDRAEFGLLLERANEITTLNNDDRLLYARCLLKKGEAESARNVLQAIRTKPTDKRIEIERDLLITVSSSRLEHDNSIYRSFARLSDRCAQLRNHELCSEIAYWWSRALIDDKRFDQAREIMPQILQKGLEAQTVRSLHIRSTFSERAEDYRQEAQALLEVLKYLESATNPHYEMRAHATETLAALAREIYLPEARPYVERSLQREWPLFFARQRFQSLKALGWICALDGDTFNAFRYLKAATSTVDLLEAHQRPGWRTVAWLDRAYLAWCIGERSWSRQELAEAEETERDVVWEKTGDERIALLLFAELFGHFDPGKSASYLAKYERLSRIKNPLINFSFGPRIGAMANYAAGVVYLNLGYRSRAINALQQSFKVFDRIGYDWRAGRCALRLYESTGDESDLRVADEKLRHYSSSWLGAELRAQGRSPSPVDLTPMQRSVFQHVLEGKSTDEIAAAIKRSKFTVRTHVKQILKAFGVSSRPALLVEAARRNLR